MIISDEKYPEILDKIADFLSQGEVELLLVGSEQMRSINLNQRGIDYATDVLSFPLDLLPHHGLGSIVINTDLAAQKATELGHSLDDELALLFTHGMLHILGYDHENDDGAMRRYEMEIMERFNLPKSLIVRTME